MAGNPLAGITTGGPKQSAGIPVGKKAASTGNPLAVLAGAGTGGTGATKSAEPKKSSNFLMTALNLLDKPRALLVSSAAEVGDALGGNGFSVNDIRQNVNRNYSVGDVLNESTNLPGWAKAGLGFIGDVVLDPLTYAGGAGLAKQGAQGVAKQLLDPKLASALAAKNISKETAEKAASDVLKGGYSRLDPEVAKALGEITGKSSQQGVYLRGGRLGEVRLPGSAAVSRTLDQAGNAAKKAFVSGAAGSKVAQKLSGSTDEVARLKVEVRKNGDINAWHKIEASKAGRMAEKAAESKMTRDLLKYIKPVINDKASMVTLRKALEGDLDAIAAMEKAGQGGVVADVRQWLDKAADDVGIPRLQDYFPRQLSAEARRELKASLYGGKTIGPAMKRELVEGTEFMGEVLTGTNAEIRDQVERLLKQRWGNDLPSFFNENTAEVLSAYTKQIARRKAQLAAKEELIRRIGLAPRAAKAGGAGAKAAPDARAAGAQAGAQAADEAAGVAEEMAAVGVRSTDNAAAGAADEAAAAPGPRMSAKDRIRYETLREQRDTLAKQFDHIQASQYAADLKGIAARLRQSAADARTRAAQVQDNTLIRRNLKEAERMEAEAAKLEAKLSRQDTLRERIAKLDEEIAGLDPERAAQKKAQRDAFEEARRLADEADAQPDPKMGQKARLESEAAEAAAENPPDGKSYRRVRNAIKDDVNFQNTVKDAARRLMDGTDVEEQADILTRISRLNTGEGTSAFLREYDRLNNFLKRYQIFTPGFHIRNAFGGEFNNFLAGVDRKNKYAWRQIWAKSKFGQDPDKLTGLERAIFDKIESAGVFGNQATDIAEEAIGRSWNPFAKNFAPINWSRNTGSSVEAMLRGELALDRLIKTGGGRAGDLKAALKGNNMTAFEDVAKFHFDYNDLTGFERGVLKRIMPFYTWTRKNLPLQLEQMYKQPAKYTAYLKAKNNIEVMSEDEGLYPSYFDDLLSIRLPKGIPGMGGNSSYIAPDLPFRDVGEYVNPMNPLRGLDMIKSAVAVPIKVPLEMQAGKKFFTDQPFYEGWSKAPGTWNKIPGLMPALATFGLADRGANGEYFMDQRDQYKVEQFMPVLARIRRMMPSGEGDEFLAERQMSTNLSTLLGIGLRANTPAAQTAELKRRQKNIQAAARKQRDLGYIE